MDHVTASPQIRDTSVSGGQGTDNAEVGGSIALAPPAAYKCSQVREHLTWTTADLT